MSNQLTHITLLTDGIYPFVMGGMQKHSYYLAKYFANKKVQVDLYHYIPANKRNVENAFTAEELKHIKLIEIEMPPSDRLPGHYLRQSKKYSQELYQKFEKEKASQFIYAQGFTAWAFIENKKKIQSPIGVNFHGVEPLQNAADLKSELQKQLLKPFMLLNLKKADYVFSLGSNLTSLLIKNGIASEKIIQIQIGIERNWIVEKINPTKNPINFLFIGRNERRKAVKELSEAIKKISSDEAHFHFIGPINAFDLAISESEMKQTSNIHLHGAIYDQDKIKTIVRSCDVLICASFSEGMPTVILEAMSCGLTCLASNVGAINELVNSNTGWIIDKPDSSLIHQVLCEIISSSMQSIDEKKENAKALIQSNFIWDTVIEKTICEIEQII
jgi:glycosyltransferase involved in cell wall biosynthesis